MPWSRFTLFLVALLLLPALAGWGIFAWHDVNYQRALREEPILKLHVILSANERARDSLAALRAWYGWREESLAVAEQQRARERAGRKARRYR